MAEELGKFLDAIGWLRREAPKVATQRVLFLLRGGTGAYIVAMVLLSCAFVAARSALLETDQPRHTQLEELKALLTRQQEPLREELRPALSAAVLGEAVTWSICEAPDLNNFADEIYRYFLWRFHDNRAEADKAAYPTLAKWIKDESWRQPVPDPALPSTGAGGSPASAAAQPIPSGPGNAPAAGSSTAGQLAALSALPQMVDVSSPPPTPLIGPARAGTGVDDTLWLSSLVVGLTAPPNPSQRLVHAIAASRQIGSLRSFVDVNPSSAGPRAKAFYFISLDGALRIVPPMKPVALAAHKTFIGASYVNGALGRSPTAVMQSNRCLSESGFDRYHSLVYLDVLGSGAVVTVCYPVTNNSDAAVGVFCEDFNVSAEAIYTSLANSHLFEARLTKSWWMDSNPPKRHELVCGVDRGYLCPRDGFLPIAVGPERVEEIKKLRAWTASWSNNANEAKTSGRGDVDMVEQDVYAVAIAHDAVTNSTELAILRPRDTSAGWRVVGYTAAALSLLGVATAVMSWSRSRQEKRRRATLERGLQVGVIRLDAAHHIVRANDRAEELLMVELPLFGTEDVFEGTLQRFGSLIGDRTYWLDNGRWNSENYKDTHETLGTHDVREYFVYVESQNSVLRVIGSSMKEPGGITTYGTIEAADDQTAQSLREYIRKTSKSE